jgi:tight adherence protein B
VDPSIIALIVFLAVASASAAVMYLVRDLVVGRSGQLEGAASGIAVGARSRRNLWAADFELVHPRKQPIDESFDRLVSESGLQFTTAAAFLFLVTCGLAAGGSLFLWYENVVVGLLGALGGMVLALLLFVLVRTRQMRKIQEQMPEVLDLMARAVGAGKSLDQAVDLVAREIPGTLGREFRRCSKQLEMGLSISAAVHSLAARIRQIDMRLLAITISVHRQTGGNLTPILERLAGVMRDRLNYRRQFRAATAAGRLAMGLIGVVALFLFVGMLVWQPDYVQRFYQEPLGWTLLGAAAGLQVLGLCWLAGLLRTDY